MKTVTSTITTANGGNHVIVTYLIKMIFPSGTQYVTPAGVDITWASNVYIGVSAAGKIEEIRETLTNKVVGLRFEVTGTLDAFRDVSLDEVVKGSRVEVWTAWFNPGSYVPLADPVLEWVGFVDTMPFTARPSSATITVTTEGRFVRYARPRVRRHNLQDHQAQYPGDTFYKYLPEMVERIIIFPSREWFKR